MSEPIRALTHQFMIQHHTLSLYHLQVNGIVEGFQENSGAGLYQGMLSQS